MISHFIPQLHSAPGGASLMQHGVPPLVNVCCKAWNFAVFCRLFYQQHPIDARYANVSMIGRDQHFHIINLNIFHIHYRINGTNNGREVRTQMPPFRKLKPTGKLPGHRWHFCGKSQRVLDLQRYGSHRSYSRSTPLLRSLTEHSSLSILLSSCYRMLSLFPWPSYPLFKCTNTGT